MRLDTYRFEDEQLTGAIERCSPTTSLKPRHRAVSQQLQASPGNVRAADLIERLAATGEPVTTSRRGSRATPARAKAADRCGARPGGSASITALCTAGVDPIVADSPIPFAPNGFSGVGVSVCAISNHGSSEAAGMPYVARLPLIGFPVSS